MGDTKTQNNRKNTTPNIHTEKTIRGSPIKNQKTGASGDHIKEPTKKKKKTKKTKIVEKTLVAPISLEWKV